MEEKKIWLENIHGEYAKMRKIMVQQSVPKERDRLVDQLNWLSFQMKHYAETGEIEKLMEDYNWVVTNFNHALGLPREEKISSFEELRPRRAA